MMLHLCFIMFPFQAFGGIWGHLGTQALRVLHEQGIILGGGGRRGSVIRVYTCNKSGLFLP